MNTTTTYFNPKSKQSKREFHQEIALLHHEISLAYEKIIIVCIGSDRATGDCLGPLIGYKLQTLASKNIMILGTLQAPVHANNLSVVCDYIKKKHPDAFVLAIDASLGIASHIGYVTFQKSAMLPGIGVNKNLPAIGHASITGIVNTHHNSNLKVLQTTRLCTVMTLADFICEGLITGLSLHVRSTF